MTELSPCRILFVCQGNICRSPMAQEIFRHLAAGAGGDGRFLVSSAGFTPHLYGMIYHPLASEECDRHGIRLQGTSRLASMADLRAHDVIVAMDRPTLDRLWALDPRGELASRFYVMGEFTPASENEGFEIADPLLSEERNFSRLFDRLQGCCRELLQALLASSAASPLPPSRAVARFERFEPGTPLAADVEYEPLRELVRGHRVLVLGPSYPAARRVLGEAAKELVSAETAEELPGLRQKFDVIIAMDLFRRVLPSRVNYVLLQISVQLGSEGVLAVRRAPGEPKVLGQALRARFPRIRRAGPWWRRWVPGLRSAIQLCRKG